MKWNEKLLKEFDKIKKGPKNNFEINQNRYKVRFLSKYACRWFYTRLALFSCY